MTQAAISICILPFSLPPSFCLSISRCLSLLSYLTQHLPLCISISGAYLYLSMQTSPHPVSSLPPLRITHTLLSLLCVSLSPLHDFTSVWFLSCSWIIPFYFKLWSFTFAPLGVSPKPQGSEPGRAVRRIQPLHQWVDRWRPLLAHEGGLCRYILSFCFVLFTLLKHLQAFQCLVCTLCKLCKCQLNLSLKIENKKMCMIWIQTFLEIALYMYI